jgi:hypothetical protein
MGRGSVWEGRVRLARREEEADPQRSVTDKQRRQRTLPSQTLRAAGGVFPGWTALVRAEQTAGGLPRRSPPCPTQNSPAAEPLPIFRQALGIPGSVVGRMLRTEAVETVGSIMPEART